MTHKVTKPRPRKVRAKPVEAVRADTPRKDTSPQPPPSKSPEECQPQTCNSISVTLVSKETSLDQTAITTIRSKYQLPMLYEPSMADAYDRAFISHFVDLQSCNGGRPWITHLPGLRNEAKTPALKLSIRATCMAFYAKIHGNKAILEDAHKWYTISLNSQRRALAQLNPNRIPTDEEFLSPILLGLYEVYTGTNSSNVIDRKSVV